jgi:hypothetical protein
MMMHLIIIINIDKITSVQKMASRLFIQSTKTKSSKQPNETKLLVIEVTINPVCICGIICIFG